MHVYTYTHVNYMLGFTECGQGALATAWRGVIFLRKLWCLTFQLRRSFHPHPGNCAYSLSNHRCTRVSFMYDIPPSLREQASSRYLYIVNCQFTLGTGHYYLMNRYSSSRLFKSECYFQIFNTSLDTMEIGTHDSKMSSFYFHRFWEFWTASYLYGMVTQTCTSSNIQYYLIYQDTPPECTCRHCWRFF